MARFPGFIQLQAGLLDPKLGLDRARNLAAARRRRCEERRERSWWHDVQLQLRTVRVGRAAAGACSTARSRCGSGSTRSASRCLAPFADKLAAGHRPGARSRRTASRTTRRRAGLSERARRRRRPRDAGRARCCRACGRGRSTAITAALPSEKEAFAAYRELLETARPRGSIRLPASGGTRGAGGDGAGRRQSAAVRLARAGAVATGRSAEQEVLSRRPRASRRPTGRRRRGTALRDHGASTAT